MPKTSQTTRDRLIQAAAELIWTGSFESTGVDLICQTADVRKGSFYHYFESKSDLAGHSLKDTWARVRTEVFDPVFERRLTGINRIRRLIDEVDAFQRKEFEVRQVYLGCPFGGLGQEMAHRDERLRMIVLEIFDAHISCFERALVQAADERAVASGDLNQRARNLFVFMEGALLMAKVANSPDQFTLAMRSYGDVIGAPRTERRRRSKR